MVVVCEGPDIRECWLYEPTARKLTIAHYGKLLKGGVRIFEWPHSVLHAKTMVVDDNWATVGSANLDGRALSINYEANFAITDTVFASAMLQRFRRDVAASREITYEAWCHRSAGQKASEILLKPVEGQF